MESLALQLVVILIYIDVEGITIEFYSLNPFKKHALLAGNKQML